VARAAPSLATLFDQWTNGFAAQVYSRSPYNTWLHIDDGGRNPFDVLLERAPDLDPFAFPVDLSTFSHEDLIRQRQRECGVDLDRVDRFECHEQLLDEVDVVSASLRR
jgi:hypothetical protein